MRLSELIRRNGLPSPPVAALILRDLAKALTELHATGVAHGRIGLDAVLIEDGRARFADDTFGAKANPEADRADLRQLAAELGVSVEHGATEERPSVRPALEQWSAGVAPRKAAMDLLDPSALLGHSESIDDPTGTEVFTPSIGEWSAETNSTFDTAGQTWDGEPSSSSSVIEGRFIAGYRVERRIGLGTFANVYLGVRPNSGERAAIKILHLKGREDPHQRRRLAREAAALESLRHPHIVSVLGSGETERGLVYVLLEYLEGTALDRLITTSGPLEPQRALRLAGQIAEGLAHAHSMGIVHRDLKSANVMITGPIDDEQVKILDFGLARFVDPGEQTKLTRAGVLGTPAFMAPEQATSAGEEIGPAADMYALGVILYHMLMARLPFDGSIERVLYRKTHEHAPSVDAPPHVASLVASLLERSPRDRPGSASSVAETLRTFLPSSLEPTKTARTVETLRPLAPESSKADVGRPRAAGLAILSLSLVATGVLIGLLRGPEDPPAPAETIAAPSLAPVALVETHAAPPDPTELIASTTVAASPESPKTPAIAAAAKPRAPAAGRSVDASKARGEVRRSLRAKGLRPSDLGTLDRLGATQSGAQWWKDTAQARRVDASSARALAAQIEQWPPSVRVLDLKLDRILEGIRRAANERPLSEHGPIREVEDRYFALRRRSTRSIDGDSLLRALEEASSLQAAIDRL